jgi:molybdopterin synthase sulfur carrier subunit
MAIVFIPVPIRKLTNGAAQIQVKGTSLRDVIDNLDVLFPGTRERIVEGDSLVPGIAAMIDGVAALEGLRVLVGNDSEVHFIPAMEGGSL